MEPGAVVCRVSPAFIRFGTFQLPSTRAPDDLRLVGQLADYTIRHHYPHLEGVEVLFEVTTLAWVAQLMSKSAVCDCRTVWTMLSVRHNSSSAGAAGC
jgi:uncharacterized protein YdiU (UPF0061 family)